MFIPNRKHTTDHLKGLTGEVEQFHPILNVLFRKLPGIERVHYNHGPNELGADFLLYRRDQALRKTTCIGVVVKIGAIKQDNSDVDRQIRECFIARKAADGVEVQIREVWVVSNQEITNNAKEVISKQYSDRKIEFIPGQELAGMIDEFAPDSFVTTSPALQAFAEETLTILEAEDRRSIVVPGLESFYIEPSISKRDFDGYGKARADRRVPDIAALLVQLIASDVSVVQAGAGGGKSRLARELARRVLESTQFADGLVVPTIQHASRYAEAVASTLGATVAEIRLKTGKAARPLVFIDGFDELDIEGPERTNFVDALMRSASDLKASVVLLSRPFNEVSVLGGRVKSTDVYRIDPLRGPKAIDFLSRIAAQVKVRSKLITDLNQSVLFRALEGAPIAYMLLGRLISENDQELPSNLTELFQKYTELVLGRWEVAKGLRSQQEYEVIVEALVWAAEFMLENKLKELSQNELQEWIANYCQARGISIDPSTLVERMCNRNSILYLRSDVGAVGFRHRAFAEFFYARHLERKAGLELSGEVFSPYWVNSYYFLAGMKRDCPDMLTALIEMELETEDKRLLRALHFGNFLLAGYLTPKTVCRRAVITLVDDLATLYVEACDPASRSELTQVPTIQLLCAITAIFRSQYGYKFFQSALEEAIFEVEARQQNERGAIALLMLDSAYKEAGGELRFDSLIKNFGDALPVVVKLAIQHESDRMNVVTDAIKKMERNLRRSFQANRLGSKVFLDKLYKTPIRQLDKRLI